MLFFSYTDTVFLLTITPLHFENWGWMDSQMVEFAFGKKPLLDPDQEIFGFYKSRLN